MKISKIYLRICSLLFVCILVCGSILRPVVTYASPYDLMINTDSNALMTLELDDSDYLMMSPRSSLGSVINTVRPGGVILVATYYDSTGNSKSVAPELVYQNNIYSVKHSLPSGSKLYMLDFYIQGNSLPTAGSYAFSFDLGNQFSMEYDDFRIYSYKTINNVSPESYSLYPPFNQNSGDLYVAPYNFNLTNVDQIELITHLKNYSSQNISNLDFSFSIGFKRIPSNPDYPSTGVNPSESDYQDDVSSSLSDLSSSVDSMTEDLSSAAQNLEYISTSQNLIIQGIDNVVMHISDQLFAFWDQLFNLIHVPTMAKMDDIISAINNMDLEIEVNLDGLKTTINNMSTAVQNKLQSTTDQITGGYDNSGIVSDQTELDSALNEYQQAEDELFDDAKDHLTNFEFDTPLDQFIKPIQDISYFMTGIFNGLAGLNIPIQFSLTLTIALILIGYYRIKR